MSNTPRMETVENAYPKIIIRMSRETIYNTLHHMHTVAQTETKYTVLYTQFNFLQTITTALHNYTVHTVHSCTSPQMYSQYK